MVQPRGGKERGGQSTVSPEEARLDLQMSLRAIHLPDLRRRLSRIAPSFSEPVRTYFVTVGTQQTDIITSCLRIHPTYWNSGEEVQARRAVTFSRAVSSGDTVSLTTFMRQELDREEADIREQIAEKQEQLVAGFSDDEAYARSRRFIERARAALTQTESTEIHELLEEAIQRETENLDGTLRVDFMEEVEHYEGKIRELQGVRGALNAKVPERKRSTRKSS